MLLFPIKQIYNQLSIYIQEYNIFAYLEYYKHYLLFDKFMNQTLQISLSEKLEFSDYKHLQLYSNPSFQLPELEDFQLQPFQQEQIIQPKNYQQLIPLQTQSHTYNPEYEKVIAALECFPFCLAASEKYILIASKSQFVIFDKIDDFKSHKKIQIDQIITSMDILGENLIIGTKSGRIIYYLLNKRVIISQVNYFIHRILKIKFITPSRICAIDSLGSFIFFDFNIKIIMDKPIITSINTYQIYQEFRQKKRDKIKKIWKTFISKQVVDSPPQMHSHTTLAILNQKYKSYLYQNQLIAAVFRKKQVKVLLLNQDKLTIKSQQILLQNQDIQQVGIFTFGIGGFQSSNQTHLLLVISVHKTINYFKFVRIQEIHQWHHVYTLECQNQIYYGEFISNNLVTYLTQKGIQISNVGQPLALVKSVNFQKFNYIDFFNEQQKSGINKKIVNRNLLKCIWDFNIYLCIQGKRLIIGKISTWQQYLDQLTNDFKWEQAMNYAYMIYCGKIKKLARINENIQARNQEMRNFFQKITLTYFTFEIKKRRQDVLEIIEKCLQFMFDTENHKYLFTTIYEAIQSENHKNEFFIVLQNFIKMKKVTHIDQKALQDCINTYKSQNKIKLLQTLIIHLKLQTIDQSIILETCLRSQLYKPLIYICVSQSDYITPILKLCGKISLEQDIKQGEREIGEIIFWYVKNCLDGQYIEYMNQQKYTRMLEKLITYIFLPISLKIMCKTNPKYFFSLLKIFFQPKIFQIVLENSQRFHLKKNNLMNESIFQKQSEFIIYEQIFQNIIFTDYFASEITQYQLNKFLMFILLKNQFPFNQTFKIRAAIFFIHHPKIFHHQKQLTQQEQSDINAYLMRLFDSIFSKSTSEISLEQNLNKFITNIYSADTSQILAESLCYLYHMSRKFNKCFQIYLKMKNLILRQKLLQYLEQNIHIIQLQKQTLSNILSLIKINQNKTLKLLVNHLPNHYQEIISKLTGFPQHQLKYIETIFLTRNQLSDELKIIHLNIVIKYQRNQVQNFLKKMDYPLDEAYRICQVANHKPGMAFISCKKGEIQKGAMILSEVFCEASDEIIKSIARKLSFDKTNLYYRLNQLLRVCSNEYNEDKQQGEVIWFNCLEKVFKHIKIENLIKENIPILIRQLLSQIVSIILSTMCSQISVEFFINKFTKNFSSLPFHVFSKAYLLLRARLNYSENVYLFTKGLFEQKHLTENIQIYKSYTKGIISKNFCQYCEKMISHNNIHSVLVFDCGHSFHSQCSGYQCEVCRDRNIILTFTGTKSQPMIIRQDKQLIEEKQKRKSLEHIQKLKLFEQQINAIGKHIRQYW